MADFLDKLLDRTMPGLTKALDLTWQRHEAISSNIANSETPAYRAVEVNFERELKLAFGKDQGAMLKTNSKHLDNAGTREAHFSPDLSGATKADGNNVDIDIQMGKLAFNSGQYSIATNLMRKKLGVFRKILSESR